jgi:hypothetical protein
LKH